MELEDNPEQIKIEDKELERAILLAQNKRHLKPEYIYKIFGNIASMEE